MQQRPHSILEMLHALFDYRLELVVWVLGSVLLYGVAVNARQRLRDTSSSRLSRYLTALESWPHSLWLSQALRFVYYLCIPYLALSRGVTSPILMGMWGTDWLQLDWASELARGLALGLGILFLLLWSWRRFLQLGHETHCATPPVPYAFQRRVLSAPWGWGLIILEVLYLEMHWAFYRGATIRAFGDYYGVFAGFLLVLAEWELSPSFRHNLSLSRRDGEAMTTVATAFSIAVIYYLTANLWLCVAVHLIIQFGLVTFLATSGGLADQERERD
jgi:hypothetical protein